jgi:hypothetical protein
MQSDPLAESWQKRNQKVIQNLNPKYPTPSELQKLSTLAQVDSPKVFGTHIKSILFDAHLNNAALRVSTPAVKSALKNVTQVAQALAGALRGIDIGTGGSAEHAGTLLEWELNHPLPQDGLFLIPHYVQVLESLSEAASRAVQRAKSTSGPKGASGSPAFNPFIESLLLAAWQRGGHWTIFRSADGTWRGSLLEAVELLKPYLPEGFLPQAELGRSIEHIRKKFKDYTTKSL